MNEVPDPVLDELQKVKDAESVYIASRAETREYAVEQGFDNLVEFIDSVDAAAYHDALVALPD